MEKSATAWKRQHTIPQFCAQRNFSVAFFYKLKKAGKAPRVTKIGWLSRINDDDANAWDRAMAEASDHQAAA